MHDREDDTRHAVDDTRHVSSWLWTSGGLLDREGIVELINLWN
jgi:hypothetical protein